MRSTQSVVSHLPWHDAVRGELVPRAIVVSLNFALIVVNTEGSR